MGRKILLAATGVGVVIAAFAAFLDFGQTLEVPRYRLGMIFDTMAHLKAVKLTPVAKLPDYAINNDGIKKWQEEAGLTSMMYDSVTPLDIMISYPQAD